MTQIDAESQTIDDVGFEARAWDRWSSCEREFELKDMLNQSPGDECKSFNRTERSHTVAIIGYVITKLGISALKDETKIILNT